MIAEKMGMDKSDCDIVYNAAILHNIGNVFVSEHVLRKNGKLTSDEFAEVKQHTTRGAELLKDIKNIPHAQEAAMYHHERYDGEGYPYGKKENEIPLIARIVAVADAYDAMSNDRPYRMKLANDRIREEFIKNRGTQFDPTIVTAFLDIMGERNL
jgi:HD-GYP domain-containing protein (c-di-GMP phosphodiesterase class II)